MIPRIEGSARRIAVAGLLLASASAANAAITVSDPFIVINAQSGAFSGSYSVPLSDATPYSDPSSDLWYWSNQFQVPIMDGSHVVATLVSMTVIAGRQVQPDGSQRFGIDVDYTVVAGAGQTRFEMITPTLGFNPINGASATTSATRIGTDQDFNGISINPALLSGFGYEAKYNGGTLFQSYFNTPLSNPSAGGSVNESANMTPAGAFLPLIGPVSSMQARFMFDVSANDSSGGTSTYSITPAPGAAALLGLGGLLAARRRR
jgi:MYXO-CTERM domain-containing protein